MIKHNNVKSSLLWVSLHLAASYLSAGEVPQGHLGVFPLNYHWGQN